MRTQHIFTTIRVTRVVDELILDLEAAFMRHQGSKGREAIENSYAALNQRRLDLYSYIKDLEDEADAGGPLITKRFV